MISNSIDVHHSETREERSARIAALGRFLDWAEREASDLRAQDVGACLQLARMALLASDRRPN